MKEIHLIKTDAGYFIPAYNSDKELSDQIKTGEVIKVKYSKPRNYKFHKKYFALLNLAYDNYDTGNSFKWFRSEIIKRAGYYEEYINFKGVKEYTAKSISFGNMDEITFNELYSKSLDVIIKYVLTGNTKEEIEKQIINFM